MTDLKRAEDGSADVKQETERSRQQGGQPTTKAKPWAKYAAIGTFMFFLVKGLGWVALAVLGFMGVAEVSG